MHCDLLNAMGTPNMHRTSSLLLFLQLSEPRCVVPAIYSTCVWLVIYTLCSIYSNILRNTSFCNEYHEGNLSAQSPSYHTTVLLILLSVFTSPFYTRHKLDIFIFLLSTNPYLSAYWYSYPSTTVCWWSTQRIMTPEGYSPSYLILSLGWSAYLTYHTAPTWMQTLKGVK